MGIDNWHVEKRSSSDLGSDSFKDVVYSESFAEHGPLTIIVLGASGDLAKKTTFPTLFNLYRQGFLPLNEVRIFGYARSKMEYDELRECLRRYIIKSKDATPKQLEEVSKYGYRLLDEEISKHECGDELPSRRLFYLALPPSVYPPVSKKIKEFCMTKSTNGGWTRVVVEKPFGKDLDSAEKLNSEIGELFDESQVYRIDHYLGKELVQNLVYQMQILSE